MLDHEPADNANYAASADENDDNAAQAPDAGVGSQPTTAPEPGVPSPDEPDLDELSPDETSLYVPPTQEPTAAEAAAERAAVEAAQAQLAAPAPTGDQPAGTGEESVAEETAASEPAEGTTRRRRAPRKRASAAATEDAAAEDSATGPDEQPQAAEADLDAEPAPKKTTRRRRKASDTAAEPTTEQAVDDEAPAPNAVTGTFSEPAAVQPEPEPTSGRRPISVLFMPPQTPVAAPPAERAPVERPAADHAEGEEAEAEVEGGRRRRRGRRSRSEVDEQAEPAVVAAAELPAEDSDEDEDDEGARARRRRGRRGRGRGKGTADDVAEDGDEEGVEQPEDEQGEEGDDEPLTRRRRRRRRKGAGGEDGDAEDGVHTVVKIREPRAVNDEVQGVAGSTRLEAKRQRRRDGREQRRTRPPILTESEFLARREAVDRVMVIRESADRTQIAVMEDGVLVEHYVTRSSSATMVGNVYLGKVQNVLPSMEAAFVDLGRGRNAVLYAGEVNWDAAGLEGKHRSIEQALKSGDSVLVQVTKDPIGHKGARLSSHIALSGRHLVYVPNGNASGISRKLSDVERKRLRDILKKMVPEGAGVIVRTAAEGATEDDLARDVTRLQGQWDDIQDRARDGGAPALLYAEPDLVVRVVRDLFNEDFKEVIIQGDGSYDTVEEYLGAVSPDLVDRVHRHTGMHDVFATYRIDEQILKGLDRKVFLPSGGHLVIDRTEAMTVVDVNTGKYTGAGGNLEETVTRNNLEAAEEIVRQLRLRDLGGIVVIDFIDMVLESNRELVLRRLTECLGRDRTKHQVTEITSLGLVQMTRKRIGAGLLEAFSEPCEHCKGRGVIIHTEPVPERKGLSQAQPEQVEPKSAPPSRAAAEPVAKAPERDRTPYVDTEGYDLSRYELADEPGQPDDSNDNDGDEPVEGDEESSESVARRRTRRGGRRRTRP